MGLDEAIDITAEQTQIVLALTRKAPAEYCRLGLRLPRQMDLTASVRFGFSGFRHAGAKRPGWRAKGSIRGKQPAVSGGPVRLGRPCRSSSGSTSSGITLWCWWRGKETSGMEGEWRETTLGHVVEFRGWNAIKVVQSAIGTVRCRGYRPIGTQRAAFRLFESNNISDTRSLGPIGEPVIDERDHYC